MTAAYSPDEPTPKNWRSFSALTVVTALTAFHDNFARFLLLPLSGWLVARQSGFEVEHLLALMMVLPYILFAPTSGWIADRFPKNRVIRWSAWLQLLVLGLMSIAVWQESLVLSVISFFLLALQSTLLSPAKLGILKELLGSRRLALGSGLMDGILILAILAGQICAGLVFDWRLSELGDAWSATLTPVLFILIGGALSLVLTYFIEKTQSAQSAPFSFAVAGGHVRDLRGVWGERSLRLSALGVCFFWGFSSFIIIVIYQVAQELHGGEAGTATANSLMVATASVGIALGSMIAGWLSRKGTELGLVPLGGGIMASGVMFLAFADLGGAFFSFGLFVAGLGASFFLVPVKAHLVDLSPNDQRGKVLSVSNLLNNLAGLLAVGLQFGCKVLKVPIAWQMGLLALCAIIATWYVMKLLPKNFWRFIALSLIRSLYRIRVSHADRMPMAGGVILCPNHMSFVDALVISAASPRPVRFLIAERCFRQKAVGRFAKMFDAVPVSPQRAKEAIRLAADEAAAGNVVCLFPEGQLSRHGASCEVKRGFEMIARKANCPVVPAYMHGLWGTFTSFSGGRYFKKWPRRLGAGLQVLFGEPIAARQASSAGISKAWRALASEALDAESLDQSKFADPSCFLSEEPAIWWEELHEVGELPAGDFAPLVRQTRELAAVAFWQRGDRVLLEWEPRDRVSRVLGLLLAPLVGAKVALVGMGLDDEALLTMVRKFKMTRVVLRRKEVSRELSEALLSEGAVLHLLAEWIGDEPALSQEGVYPSLLANELIITWSMPHPDERGSSMAQFQPGWREGSVGRLLLGTFVPEGWVADGNHFLAKKVE